MAARAASLSSALALSLSPDLPHPRRVPVWGDALRYKKQNKKTKNPKPPAQVSAKDRAMALSSSSLSSRPQRARLPWLFALCLLACCLSSLPACSERHIPSSPSTTPALPSSAAATQTRLFDVGDRPKVIWPEIKPGFTQRLTWHPTIEGQTWRVIAEVAVIEAEASGAWVIEQSLLEVSPNTASPTANPPGTPSNAEVPEPARARRWRAGGADFTDRSPLEAAPNATPSNSPSASPSPALFQSLHEQLQLLSLRFPLEPIGEGAFWDAALSDTLAVGMVLESSSADQAQVRVDWPADPCHADRAPALGRGRPPSAPALSPPSRPTRIRHHRLLRCDRKSRRQSIRYPSACAVPSDAHRHRSLRNRGRALHRTSHASPPRSAAAL